MVLLGAYVWLHVRISVSKCKMKLTYISIIRCTNWIIYLWMNNAYIKPNQINRTRTAKCQEWNLLKRELTSSVDVHTWFFCLFRLACSCSSRFTMKAFRSRLLVTKLPLLCDLLLLTPSTLRPLLESLIEGCGTATRFGSFTDSAYVLAILF